MPDTENNKKSVISETEQKVLDFWNENKIFERSLEKEAPNGDFVFFDGPPFATGTPHYGHILAGIIKDVIPRYQTMKGKYVPRKWGWDCHGLPIENLIEKDLGLKTKQDIEDMGIDKFNEAAHGSVLRYEEYWKKFVPRIGRWVDMENDYKTMDWKYTESVWWVFNELNKKGLIYEGHKAMHLCPRCETTLANFEVNQGYKDIKDISVTVKFEIEEDGQGEKSGKTPSFEEERSDGKKLGVEEDLDGAGKEPKTYILAWTTTPWTLPGNVALAVNPDIGYVEFKEVGGGHSFIVAKNLAAKVFDIKDGRIYKRFKYGESEYSFSGEFRGRKLIGKSYKPVFDYYSKNEELVNRKNGWKIYGADFVTTEDGTGVVHIAPAFGEDDMRLGRENNLPFVQHVGKNGQFKPEVTDFAGMLVKPKDTEEDKIAHMRTDIEVIKWLQENDKFFSKTNLTHSYPHCWRCHTPLLNYATSSWFVDVPKIKDKLIENNKQIKWVPENIKEGRFGKWLEGARDWAISRTRYWGAPLPVWKCEKCEEVKSVGSIEDIKNNVKQSGNKYFVMRHGEAEQNVAGIIDSKLGDGYAPQLSEKGKKQIAKSAERLKKEGIDLIFTSPFERTRETAEVVAEAIGFDKKEIIEDKRIEETNVGTFNGKKSEEYHAYFSDYEEKFTKRPPKGENLMELKNRMMNFLEEIDGKYENKKILIVSHEYPVWMLFAGAKGFTVKETIAWKEEKGDDFIKTGELMELDYSLFPRNKNFELDLHRPYIDDVKLKCTCGEDMKRIPDVFDCWFESGSMPYGQAHYPFENKEEFEKNFPAEFIAEGLDQTRGWFYTLLVLSTALFDKTAYKNVVVNGMLLAEDGKKMSKSLKNYPDPIDIVNKYGADALRYYLLSSPAVRAESLNFSEKGVDEVYKKVILRLKNVVSFYEMYADSSKLSAHSPQKSRNVLDQWILARLSELAFSVSDSLDNYELDKATRPIGDFIDDLSTWYIRRSRERFKNIVEDKETEEYKDAEQALVTTQYVLRELSKIMAPFMPFIAEEVYGKVISSQSSASRKESVHLEEWGTWKLSFQVKEILENMKIVRGIVSLGLEVRAKEGIKVRQPLFLLKVKNLKDQNLKNKEDFLFLIKDEVNVKKVVFDDNVSNGIELDTNITPELKEEGMMRDLTRSIQSYRKKLSLTPQERITLIVETNDTGKEFIKKFEAEIKKATDTVKIKLIKTEDGEEIKVGELLFKIKTNK